MKSHDVAVIVYIYLVLASLYPACLKPLFLEL